MATNIPELLDVKTVNDVLGTLYNHFGDPVSERHPDLLQAFESLQNYAMSKESQKIITEESISSFEKSIEGSYNPILCIVDLPSLTIEPGV